MKPKIAIVEDEVIIADSLEMYLQDLGYETIDPCINYSEAVVMLAKEKPDLVMIDIQLSGKKDGIDLAQHLMLNHDIPFIFLTSNSDKKTVERAKTVNPPAYLIKPFNKEELYITIELVLSNHESGNAKSQETIEWGGLEDALFIKDKSYFKRVNYDDITHIISDRVYIELHTKGKDAAKHVLRGSLNDIMNHLPSGFVRIHRSHIINMKHLVKINSIHVVLNPEIEIPITKQYRNQLLKTVQRFPK